MVRTMSRKSRIAGFVLAGGASRRMGRDKALLEFRGQALIVRAAELLRRHAHEVAIVGEPARYHQFGFTVIPDAIPNRGPLGGICAALQYSASEWNLILACDMPNVEDGILALLAHRALSTKCDAVVPQTARSLQPLCAAYHRRCLPVFNRNLKNSSASVLGALKEIRVEVIARDELARAGIEDWQFADADTPEEWEALLARHKLGSADIRS
jgi:molybdopterin-guanine dinucleotide biosynthesis protein A